MKRGLYLSGARREAVVRRGRWLLLAFLALLLLVVWARKRAESWALRALQATEVAEATADRPVVEIRGMVRYPGMYPLAEGDRLGQILDRAQAYPAPGQALPDAWRAISLSAGDRVEIGWSDADGPQLSLGMMDAPQRLLFGIPLDVNAASAKELTAISGVGPSTAGAIVAERERRGRFETLDELQEVKGIGPSTLERIRGQLTVGEGAPHDGR